MLSLTTNLFGVAEGEKKKLKQPLLTISNTLNNIKYYFIFIILKVIFGQPTYLITSISAIRHKG